MTVLPPPRCEVSNKCTELFRKFSGDTLQIKIAEHVADEWVNLYRPQVFREKLPQIMLDYRALRSEKERDQFNRDNPDWINGEDMKQYADNKRGIEGENKSNRRFLEECLQYLKQDAVRTAKIRSVLALHQPS